MKMRVKPLTLIFLKSGIPTNHFKNHEDLMYTHNMQRA